MRGLPRPLFLIGASLLTAAVAVLCAFASLGALYLAAVLAGLAFGGHWSLAPALACDFFGLHHFASNYCLLQVLIIRFTWNVSLVIACRTLVPVRATGSTVASLQKPSWIVNCQA